MYKYNISTHNRSLYKRNVISLWINSNDGISPLISEFGASIIAAKFGTHRFQGIIRNLNLQLSSGGLTGISRLI